MLNSNKFITDGLRAIAVGAIILYHAKIPIVNDRGDFTGGFIGIDIFFVISGYLMTLIILNELIETNNFSFKYFFERRIRRIIPPLILVALVSIPLAWMFLFPSYLLYLMNSIITLFSFSSNFYFYYTGQLFGEISGLFKPLLHTWSISLLVQFYIIFPIFLLLSYKYFKKNLVFILIISFAISLVLAEWGSRNYSSASFYFLHTRIWEFLAGSILAYFEIKLGHRSKKKILNLLLPSLGLILIIYSILFFNDKMLYPSFYTLFPVIGVCLIIWFSDINEFVTKLLTTRLFIGIGLISYSLYLWHYPLFAFLKINGTISGDIFKQITVIPILLLLSIFSYFLIEKKFRNKKFSFKKILIIIISFLILFFLLNITIVKKDGFPERFSSLKEINSNYNPDNFFLGKNRIDKSNIGEKIFKEEKFKILIVGDSHGEDLYNALNLNTKFFNNVHFIYISMFDDNIEEVFESNLNLMKSSDRIILSSRWHTKLEHYINHPNFFENLIKINKNIYITSNGNEYKILSKVYTILDYELLFNKSKFDYFGLKKLYFENRILHSNSDINTKIKKISKIKKIVYLNKEDYLCEVEKNECYYVDLEGNKLMYDSSHYTRNGAKFFGEKIYKLNWLQLY